MANDNSREEHPFEGRTVIDKSGALAPACEIHNALAVIETEMDWIRSEMEQLARSSGTENGLVKETDEVKIYRISERKWRDVVDALEGPMYTEEDFSNRTSVAVQRVHYQYADYKTGGFGGDNALVLSTEG